MALFGDLENTELGGHEPAVDDLADVPLLDDDVAALDETNVAIVFGAGLIADGTAPSDMLLDRLAVAARAYHSGRAGSILVSGDNRFESYSEPDVMRQVLVDSFGVAEGDIHVDYAGRRTYGSSSW